MATQNMHERESVRERESERKGREEERGGVEIEDEPRLDMRISRSLACASLRECHASDERSRIPHTNARSHAQVGDYTILNRTPKDMALKEEELLKAKQEHWQKVVKEGKFKLVEEYDPKTKENKIVVPETPLFDSFQFVSPAAPYHFFANIPDPSGIKAPKVRQFDSDVRLVAY